MKTLKEQPAGAGRSRLDPEPIPRRDFLGMAAFGSAGCALLLAGLGMARLPKAAVLPSASKKFRVKLPESLAAGEPFVPPGRSVALFRNSDGGVYAVSMICTHLGCIVKQAPNGFVCPCHGSRFALDGKVEKGPAPSSLPWFKVTPKKEGVCVVDTGKIVPPGTVAFA